MCTYLIVWNVPLHFQNETNRNYPSISERFVAIYKTTNDPLHLQVFPEISEALKEMQHWLDVEPV